MEASTAVLFALTGLQAVWGFVVILLAFNFISDDIETIIFAFVASQALYVAFSSKILQIVAGAI